MQLTLFIFLGLIPLMTTRECYVCNSNEDPDCADGSQLEKFKSTCKEAGQNYCHRISQIVGDIKSIVRTCGSRTGSKACYKTAGTNHANVCTCNDDYCNNAPGFNRQQQLMTIIISSIVMAITTIVLR